MHLYGIVNYTRMHIQFLLYHINGICGNVIIEKYVGCIRLTLEYCDIPNSGQTWSLDVDAMEAVNFDPWGREVTD